jgi:hypothetical protein
MKRVRKLVNTYWLPITIIGVALIVACGIISYSKLQHKDAKVDSTSCLSDPRSTDYQCFQAHYKEITKTKGVAAAFTDVKAQYQTNEFVKAQCHQISHVIGRTAAKMYPDVAEAYSHGDQFCWSGYYHGVMETIVAQVGKDNIENRANDICKSLREKQRYSFYHYNCVHGLGHGFMEINDYQLFTALKGCDLITDSWERSSCYGGVFMENVMATVTPGHHTDYLKNDDLLYPCDAVGGGYREQCYLMQTSHMLQVNGYDFTKTFGLCAKVEDQFRTTCYTSLGRDASGSTISDGPKTKAICLLGQDLEARAGCIDGAVKDFVSYFHSDKQAKEFCDSLPADLSGACTQTMVAYYKTF